MPNWCETTYICVGEEKELSQLYDMLVKMSKNAAPTIPNGFGNMWLGELVNMLGCDWEKFACRGEVIDFDMDDTTLRIIQGTAWCEQEGVRQAIERRFPSIKVYFRDEEPGMGIFCTNDAEGLYFSEKYFVDDGEEVDYCEDLDELKNVIESITGDSLECDIDAIQKAITAYNEKNEDNDKYIELLVSSIVD